MTSFDDETGCVVLACERADRSRLAPVVEQLTCLGYTVELASGLEQSDQPLRDAGRRLGTRAVYMLVSGPRSRGPILQHWRQLLHELGISPEQIWCGDSGFVGPSDLLRNAFEMAEQLRLFGEAGPEPAGLAEFPTAPADPLFSPARTSDAALPDLHLRVGAAALEDGATQPFGMAQPLPERSSRTRWTAIGLVAFGAVVIATGSALALWSPAGSASSDEPLAELQAAAPHPGDLEQPPTAEPDAGRAPAGELQAAAVREEERIRMAIETRSIRVLDVLLVAPAATTPDGEASEPPHPRMTRYVDAEAYCGELEIEGIAGWRLPKLGELRSLSRAGMLGRGTYWSDTLGDAFGDTHMVWNERKHRMTAVDEVWHYGNVVCVRRTHPDSANG